MNNGHLIVGVALILVLFFFVVNRDTFVQPPQRDIVFVQRPPFGYGRPFRRRPFQHRRRWGW